MAGFGNDGFSGDTFGNAGGYGGGQFGSAGGGNSIEGMGGVSDKHQLGPSLVWRQSGFPPGFGRQGSLPGGLRGLAGFRSY